MHMAGISDASGVWVIGNPGRCDASLILWGGFVNALGTHTLSAESLHRPICVFRVRMRFSYAQPAVCLQSV